MRCVIHAFREPSGKPNPIIQRDTREVGCPVARRRATRLSTALRGPVASGQALGLSVIATVAGQPDGSVRHHGVTRVDRSGEAV